VGISFIDERRNLGEIIPPGICAVFACTPTTRAVMDKQRLQPDLTHQKGPELPFHRILMIVVGCCTGGEEVWEEFFTPKI